MDILCIVNYKLLLIDIPYLYEFPRDFMIIIYDIFQSFKLLPNKIV